MTAAAAAHVTGYCNFTARSLKSVRRWCPGSSRGETGTRCGGFLPDRGCPRNCERRAAILHATGSGRASSVGAREGGSFAPTREPGDRPASVVNPHVRRWGGPEVSMLVFPRPFLAAGIVLCAIPSLAHAQAAAAPEPDFVVTPTRTPQAISRAGSAVTVSPASSNGWPGRTRPATVGTPGCSRSRPASRCSAPT